MKKELGDAKKLYQSKKYQESEDKYKELYSENSAEFTIWDKRFYSWALYQNHIKNPDDKIDLIESVDLVTELLPQENLSKKDGVCAYTLSMMKLLDYFYKNGDYESIVAWAEKLNPVYLSSKTSEFTTDTGRVVKLASNKERYYNYLSKSLLETDEYDECIEISNKALDDLDNFTNNSDVWFNWRIAKANRENGEYDLAIEKLKDIYKVKQDWFVNHEMAENYFFKGDYESSLNHAVSAALAPGDVDKKIRLYSLIEDLTEKEYPEESLKHANLIYSIRLYNEWDIDESLEEKIVNAGFDKEFREYWKIEKELNKFWKELKFKNQQISYGTITKILPHGKAGFIRSEDGNSYYFKKFEFKGDYSELNEGRAVKFYLEESYDKSKDEIKLNAVNINTLT